MLIPAYSTGSPGLFVLECNLRARLCSAGFGVGAPTECNRTAAVARFEDSERDRYNWRVRSLCGSLLLD
jgi:hypothetical protein